MNQTPLELPEPSQALLRQARKLLRRKERKSVGRFLAEGRQAVREALRLPGAVEAQGVVAIARALDVPLDSVVKPGVGLVVICAQVRDPGNAGTVIRCADAFGADAVILSADSVELYNPKTVRASVGSIFHLPIVTGVELTDAIDACRAAGLQVFATDGEGAAGRAPGPGGPDGGRPDLRSRREPQPGHRRRGLPVHQRQRATPLNQKGITRCRARTIPTIPSR